MRAPIETSLSTKKRRLSNIFSKTSTVPARLRRGDDGDRGQVGGERGPDAALDLRDLVAEVVDDVELLPGRDADGRLPHVELDPELAKGGHDRDQVVGLDVLDRDLAARRRGERGEARDLDVLGADPVRAAAAAARRPGCGGCSSRSPRSARRATTRKWQRSWMCGSHAAWPTIVSPFGEHGRHDRVLGRHDARLVEEQALPAKPVGAKVVRPVQLDLDAELRERVDVRVEASSPDHVAAGRRHGRATEAREQRAGEQERGADLAAEHRVRARSSRRRPSRHGTSFGRVHSADGAEIGEQLDHRLDVADPRDVRQDDGLEARIVAARIGSAPFLLPAARTVPDSGRPPSITNDCMRGGIVPGLVEVTRDRAWETLTRYTKSESLLRHALAVEASTRFYARRLRRGRGAVGLRRSAPRLRLRDPPHARQASAGRRRRSSARRATPRW